MIEAGAQAPDFALSDQDGDTVALQDLKARTALQELGLDYASDPAIPKHIAAFLIDQARDQDTR